MFNRVSQGLKGFKGGFNNVYGGFNRGIYDRVYVGSARPTGFIGCAGPDLIIELLYGVHMVCVVHRVDACCAPVHDIPSGRLPPPVRP